MPKGANAKREREYKELEHKFEQEGRYRGREEEVAARIVNKQRAASGETVAEQAHHATAPERSLPIANYEELTAEQVLRQLDGLSQSELRRVRTHEARHKKRKGVLEELDSRLG
ncbi:hypothetical protein H3H36_02875 [Duganella sp. FT3S]|uniref:Uncharacterized protein n=1 Tax=Rugamonas fusca TaxID=2758568 RepID=A0A7W2EE71_9BURK|nr:hypothetical protein [Rugamonas fusca]MBA5604303.1 hypothetical protein [Rugamonas fusca]